MMVMPLDPPPSKPTMPKKKSGRQVRYLMSRGSPLEPAQKRKLANEIDSGAVQIKGGKSQIATQRRKHRRVRGPLEP